MRLRNGIQLLTPSLAVLAAGAVAAGAGQAKAEAPIYHDAAYGISTTGAAPLPASPAVSSTDGRTRTDTGGAHTADRSVSIGSATVRAGAGKASATVTDFSAFDGLVSASTITATCDNAAVTSSTDGPSAGPLGDKGSVAYGVKVPNDDGSTTIIGMRVMVTATAATPATTINVAAATCAATDPLPSSSPAASTPAQSTTVRPSPTATQPTAAPTATRTASATPTPTAPTRTAGTTSNPTAPVNPDEPAPTGTSDIVPTNPNGQPRPDGATLRPAPTPMPRTTHLPVTG